MTSAVSGGVLEAHLVAMGVPVLVRAHGARAEELHAFVCAAWQDCAGTAVDSLDPVVVDVLLDDDAQIVDAAVREGMLGSVSAAMVLHDLSPRITAEIIGRNAGELLMLHAAGLAEPDSGRAVALVAASGTGKTTATRTLGRELGYLSDETVAMRPDRVVVPYPKPLSVLESADSHIKTQLAASTLGLLPAPRESVLSAVLLLTRDPSAHTVSVQPIRTVQALAHLAPQISYLARLPRPLHRVAETLDDVGGLQHVTYREAAELRGLVHDLLGGDR